MLFALFLSACTSTRPVVKIGLIAPFEGLYRQEGYDALTAMRMAIAEQNSTEFDVLPLALDSSRDVVRTTQKLLVDPSVSAVIGPYWVADGTSMGVLGDTPVWLHPYAPVGGDAWAADAVAVASLWSKQNGWRLQLAGSAEGWPPIEIAFASSPEQVESGQSVLWLGDPAVGADFALAVWARLPETPIGLYGAGAATFRQRVGAQMIGPVFLVGWIDADYPAWAESHTPNTPAAYTIYRQTVAVLQRLAGETVTTIWQPALFTLHKDGTSILSPNQ